MDRCADLLADDLGLDLRSRLYAGDAAPELDETWLAQPALFVTSYALAQLVCTFSDSAAAEGDGSVILGGPGKEPPRRYECTGDVRSRPGSEAPPSSEVTGG